MAERGTTDRAFSVTLAVAFAIKLWLTSQTRIIPASAPYDASNYLEHAKSIAMGLWFGKYDEFTLIKQPFFPIYMAGLQELGIPLTIAHLIVYGFACFVACFAVQPLVRNSLLLCAMFVVLYFNPMENNVGSWSTIRGQINGTLALLAISCAIGLFVRRRATFWSTLPWAIGLGTSFAAFWLTREEAVWMVPALVVLLAAYMLPAWHGARWACLCSRLATVSVPFVLFLTGLGSIMWVNGTVYGWYTTAENQSPEFIAAYDSLARIDPGVPTDPRFPVPHAAREIAYKVSPGAKELAPYLDGPSGASWGTFGCTYFHACGDIHGGWFIWAFRDSVSTAGHYRSGANARAFYVRLAREIDAACDARTIACRPKGHTLSPPLALANVPALASNAILAARAGVAFDQFQISPPYYVGDPTIRLDYDFIVRSVDDGYGKEPAAGDDSLKQSMLVEIAHTYQRVVPAWVALSILLVLVRAGSLFLRRSRLGEYEYLVPLTSVAVAFASLALVLALVDTLSFPAINSEYTSPMYPLVLLFASLISAVEAPGCVRYLWERLPAPEA